MTNSLNNWCEICKEPCLGHPTVCTVCGNHLSAPPPATTQEEPNTGATLNDPNNNNNPSSDAVLLHMRQAGRDLRQVLGSLRGQVQDLETLTRNILEHQQRNWQAIPPELLDPAADASSSTNARPTSAKVLQQITRIVLEDTSTLFRQGTLQLFLSRSDNENNNNNADDDNNGSTSTNNHNNLRCSAMVGEFGPVGEHHLQNASVVVASPLTGKGDRLSEETVKEIAHSVRQRRAHPVVVMQRGDGLTFVQKAIMAQKAGAKAVIIGNNTASPWPYIMKDSKNEATTLGLSIPVVMVKQADGDAILELHKKKNSTISSSDTKACCYSYSCNLHITNQSHDCVVCCERFQKQDTVVQLPECAHIFHEECAMAWLTSHNTCPYCRRELPTDDEDYERERRRQQRTHAGSSSTTTTGNGATWNEYYG